MLNVFVISDSDETVFLQNLLSFFLKAEGWVCGICQTVYSQLALTRISVAILN